jgi:hypothetical protein
MHRAPTSAALAAVAVALLTATPALAKEAPLRSVRACGLTGCVRLTDPHVLRAVERAVRGPGLGDARFGPYYRLSLRPSRNRPQLDVYLPLSRQIQLNGESIAVGPGVAARLRAELGTIQPIAPRLAGVTVGGRRAEASQVYLTMLYGPRAHPPASVWKRPDVLIDLTFAGDGTPWADWGAAEYFPSARLLHVPDGRWVRVGAGQAATIAADVRGHRQRTAAGGAGWRPVAAVLAGLALAGLVALRLPPRGRQRVA